MTRLLGVAAVAVLALVTGCSSDSSSDADPAPDPSTSPTTSPTAPEASTAPAPAVILRSYPGATSCQIQGGKLVEAGSMRVVRPVMLESASIVESTNISLGDATFVARPEGTPDSAGSYPGAAPQGKLRQDLAWDKRQPVAGAQVQPGQYYYFLPINVDRTGAHFGGTEVTWSEEGVSGVSDAEWVTDFKNQCP